MKRIYEPVSSAKVIDLIKKLKCWLTSANVINVITKVKCWLVGVDTCLWLDY